VHPSITLAAKLKTGMLLAAGIGFGTSGDVVLFVLYTPSISPDELNKKPNSTEKNIRSFSW